MAYISEKILDTLSEENRLILHLIGRLEDQAARYEELSTKEGRECAFAVIRFLTRELSKLVEL